MHLGPKAMKIIGESIAHDIAANREHSWFSHDIEVTYEEDPVDQSPTVIPPSNNSTSETRPWQ